MKKIAILTLYYKNYNYGGLLQAYALLEAIKSLDYYCEQISFERRKKDVFFRKIRTLFREPLYVKLSWFKYQINKFRKKGEIEKEFIQNTSRKFNDFMEKIPHSEVVDSSKIQNIVPNYDLFVVGSDQVWNPEFTSSIFLFDFLPDYIPRISYAASIRINSLEKKEKIVFKRNLDKFNFISVREEEALCILKDLGIEKNIDIMIDPTFLLSKNTWDEFSTVYNFDFKYIVTYLVKEKKVMNSIKRYARKMDLKVIAIQAPGCFEKGDDVSYVINDGIGPEDFVGLIKGAEIVIPNSFHGIAFSIIFNKNFVAYGDIKTDNRKKTILSEYNLLDRLLNYNCLFDEVELNEINYDLINRKIENNRNKAFSILTEVLKIYNS